MKLWQRFLLEWTIQKTYIKTLKFSTEFIIENCNENNYVSSGIDIQNESVLEESVRHFHFIM